MRRQAGVPCHDFEAQRRIPNLTGDFELDATMFSNGNRALADRLPLYLRPQKDSFGPRSAYDGYHGYLGDD